MFICVTQLLREVHEGSELLWWTIDRNLIMYGRTVMKIYLLFLFTVSTEWMGHENNGHDFTIAKPKFPCFHGLASRVDGEQTACVPLFHSPVFLFVQNPTGPCIIF